MARSVHAALYAYAPPFRFLRREEARDRRFRRSSEIVFSEHLLRLSSFSIAISIETYRTHPYGSSPTTRLDANHYLRTWNYAYEGIDRINFSETFFVSIFVAPRFLALLSEK